MKSETTSVSVDNRQKEKASILRQLMLYRYRYIVGYGFFALVLLAVLGYAFLQIPGGLTAGEMTSAAATGAIRFNFNNPAAVIDLPYHLLQLASIKLFGLSTLGIRLPSLVIALGVGVVLVLMLRRWFRDNIAIISGIMAVSTVLFLTIARIGEPMIASVFWMMLLLLAATRILHAKKHTLAWKVMACAALALSLYSPLAIYPVVIYLIAGLIHPAVRLIIKRTSQWRLIISLVVLLALIAPLIAAAVVDSTVAKTLLGLNNAWVPMTALTDIGNALFGLREGVFGTYLTPVISMAAMLVALIGFLKTCAEFHSARSYLILSWIIILIPVLMLDSQAIFMLFGPIVLLSAIGIETLVREWYRLFPRNPYARITALIPLAILVSGLIWTSSNRYFMANTYDTNLASQYNYEFESVRNELAKRATMVKVELAVTPDQLDFYNMLSKTYPNLSVVTQYQSSNSLIVTREAYGMQTNLPPIPTYITTDSLSQDSLLLRIYEAKH